jgi:N-acetylmuramoyl-L-alanine amidase
VSPDIKKTLPLILLTLLCCLLLAAPTAEAAIKGFIARDSNDSFYEYSYNELLDSYAKKIIGLSNGLYEDFSTKQSYAFLDASGEYFDYQAVISYYANSLINKKPFDLQSYFISPKAKKAAVPVSLVMVSVKDGELTHGPKTTAAGNSGPPNAEELPQSHTPIIGLALVTVDQAQTWAKSRGAVQSFVDVAPLYWDYGLLCKMRPEVLYAQAAVETNFGRYDNRVPAEYNNWAGIKTAEADGNSAEDHEKFATPEEGVRAHFNHMAAYVGLKPVGEPHDRYQIAVTQPWAGTIRYVEDLSTTWTPLEDYHRYIIDLVDQMRAIPLEGQQPEPPAPPAESQQPLKSAVIDSVEEVLDKVVVDVDVLRLRGGPSTDHEILDLLFLGTMLQVVGNQNEWLKVITPDGKNGWVHGAYVRRISIVSTSLAGRKIVIDPGHGGSDPGATGATGVKEKIINLSISEKLIRLLNDAGATVVVTRSGDQTVNNQRRIDLINGSNADIMVSIHANAYSNPASNGTETFYCARNGNNAASRALAIQLQRELIAALGLRNRGVKESSFYILTNTTIPAALVEVAFISNPAEESILLEPEAQERVAVALYRGIEAYFNQKR